MKVTAWSNGSTKSIGAGYGVRISKKDRAMHFNKAWTQVGIDIPGAGTVRANLSKSFWGRCPEIRKKEIGSWLLKNSLAPWPKGSPPTFNLTKTRGSRFKLHR